MGTSRPTEGQQLPTIRVNPGYVLGHLARALQTSEEHEDAATRERARKKVDDWTRVFAGLLSGALEVGHRTPVAGVPAWATLKVVQGGFATGELLADGPLQPHERALLAQLPAVAPGAERAALNGYFLGDDGIAELQRRLASGGYRVHVPEEGALLVVAWLLGHGGQDAARAVLDAIGPFLGRLRFYPVPDDRPPPAGAVVHLQSVGQMVRELEALKVPPRVLAQREAIQVWAPLTDRAVALFAETVTGPAPSLRLGPDGKPLRDAAGRFAIDGGWPCQHYAGDWPERARALVDDYRRLRAEHQCCGKPDCAGQNFALLRGYLEKCVGDPAALTGRDVGMIRLVLASVAYKRGLPDAPRCRELRQRQAVVAARPAPAEIARALAARLGRLPPDNGLDSLDDAMGAVTAEEAGRLGLPAGTAVPDRLGARLRRCLAAAVEELVGLGVIPSAELLARVLPQITAQVRAAGLVDPDLRRLYGAIYAAFRRRRSLLLLDLQSQVKLGELPWVRPVDALRADALDARQQAAQTLEQVVRLAVTAFPQQILPNKLVQEIRALLDAAGLDVPVVEEVAADIFMGTFAAKYLRAAQRAATVLEGTLYERYYGISYAQVRAIADVAPSPYGTVTSPAFIQLCIDRAGAGPAGRRRSVAYNGRIIEQEQILTTHNLAPLLDALGLVPVLRPRLDELARRCFAWVCRRQQQKIDAWKPRLRMRKNAAYAWRQMVLFLALLPPAEVETFLAWASGHLSDQQADGEPRLQPALAVLARAAAGRPHADDRPFLGWV